VQYAGVAIGEVMHGKLVPEHALALSNMLSPEIPTVAVDYETAIRYLQRNDTAIENSQKGWQTVSYNGHNIGWINALANRINNYYPKEWRILKQHPRFEK
jgi:NOL1/NOP2/fmu family ribosome biogenesis protein